ncbi:MAG: gliding motility-associated C-terminal domain-containing protein, partial [Ferruginibacter sp.]
NGVNSWLWSFDNMQTSTLQNVVKVYTAFGLKQTRLIVSNGVCRDTSAAEIFLDNFLKSDFESPAFVCPEDPAIFKDKSVGNIVSWNWNFGNGNTSNLKDPPVQMYAAAALKYNVTVLLVVTNNIGCGDSSKKSVLVVNNCYIAVPSAFTPNGDGINDFLYPLNAYKSKELTFSVYNRLGQRIFFSNDWMNKWDGTFKGQGADPGTYVWVLNYINSDTNQRIEQKGTAVLIR